MSVTVLRLRHARWHARRRRAREKRARIAAAYSGFIEALGIPEVMTGREVVERVVANLPTSYVASPDSLEEALE